MTGPTLALRSASYHWRGRPLVRSASINVEPGCLMVVIGPNGAGKSTLLRLLSGDLRPSQGDAFGANGVSLASTAPWRLACLRAVMTQSADVAFPFEAREVVELGLEGVGTTTSAAARTQIVERCLIAADAQDYAEQSYELLSGGEKRRVQFARALAQLEAGRSACPTQALLLDEPVANLDLPHQLRLLEEAHRLARTGVAVLAVLHDFNLAARYADTLAVMSGGVIVACGPRDDLLEGAVLSRAFDVDLCVATRIEVREPLILPSAWLRDGAS